MSKRIVAKTMLAVGTALLVQCGALAQTLYPARDAAAVNPDVLPRLNFSSAPHIGNSGTIRIYDAADDRLVDKLDLSIPPGPTTPIDPAIRAKNYLGFAYPYARTHRATNADTRPGTPSAGAIATSDAWQLTIIGGFTDGFHFYPVTVNDNVATLHPHHDLLQYGKTYYIQVDPQVVSVPGGFAGINDKRWRFTTRAQPPLADTTHVVVNHAGSGDFDTVQGAMDWVPDHGDKRITVLVRNGTYEEIVYFRNKDKVTIAGEDRDQTIIRYANNEVFNPHPANIRTNEVPGTFPSRRPAFSADNSNDIHLVNLTLQTTSRGQAEGLLITGEHNILSQVKVIGDGDALNINGTAYVANSLIIGGGDTILGRGAVFFERTTLQSGGTFMWPRNTAANHGNVFKDCIFIGTAKPTTIARSPHNGVSDYPYAEVVLLNATLTNIAPAGWDDADQGGQVHFWEFHSRTADGSLVDVAQRAAWSRQLDAVQDAKVIADYSNPSYVLGGWRPVLEPLTDVAERAAVKPIKTKKIILVGDSTTQVGSGWGGMFCANHLISSVSCINLARGGRSTFDYRAEGSWNIALSEMKTPGYTQIYVLIQFGHNDQPGKPGRSTDLATEYPANLRQYVTEARAAGAIPVLVTPLTRRSFKNGSLQDDLEPWAQSMIAVAKEMKVPLVDLHRVSVAAVQSMGARAAIELAEMMPPPEVLAAAETGTTIAAPKSAAPPAPQSTADQETPQGDSTVVFDYTHLGPKGAAVFSAMVTNELAQAVPELRRDLVP